MTTEIYLNLPEYIRACDMCHGTGEYEQTYTAGCGGGYYRSMGPCEYCMEEGRYSYKGVGYVYINDRRWRHRGVSQSVMTQIQRMNPRETA